jgi:hypothetical protein
VTQLHSLAEMAKRVPHAVICLLSALQVHELTTEAPHAVRIMIDTHARAPATGYPQVEVVRASGKARSHGLEKRTIEAEIKTCYENRLATAPSLEGRVVVKFVISGTSGQVTIIAASGLDDAVDRCVESEFRQLVFPKTGNGKDVTVDAYPLTFHR